MSKKKKPSEFSILINYIFFRIGTDIFRILPLHGAYALARFAAHCICIFDKKHYNRTVRHILHSGIRTQKKEAKELAFASLLHIVKVFVEIVKFDQIVNEDNFYDYISVGDDAMAKRMGDPDTTFQIILATGHIGNWELAGGTYSKYTGRPMTSIGKLLANHRIGEYFFHKRCTFGHTTFSKEKGIRPFITAFREDRNLTIVADQHCATSEGVEVTFFGHPARAHATPALLQLKMGIPICMPYLIRKDDDFHFEFHCEEPFLYTPAGDKEKDIQAIVQLYTDRIETAVRRFPDQWLWAHRRWLDLERREASLYIKEGDVIRKIS